MLKARSFEKVVPLLAGLAIGTATLAAEQSYETPPMLEASEVLPE